MENANHESQDTEGAVGVKLYPEIKQWNGQIS